KTEPAAIGPGKGAGIDHCGRPVHPLRLVPRGRVGALLASAQNVEVAAAGRRVVGDATVVAALAARERHDLLPRRHELDGHLLVVGRPHLEARAPLAEVRGTETDRALLHLTSSPDCGLRTTRAQPENKGELLSMHAACQR